MLLYNLFKYSSNYSDTTGSLWVYSKDEATNFNADIGNNDNFKSFKYETKLLKDAAQPSPNNDYGILKDATIATPLKYLSNFSRSPEMPLINGKVELRLKLTKRCVLAVAGSDNTNDNLNNNIFL